MNRQNVERLLAALKNSSMPKVEFDMGLYIEERGCSYAACLAGHAVLLMKEASSQKEIRQLYIFMDEGRYYELGRDWLGLTDEEAEKVFIPWTVDEYWKESPSDFTKARAIAMLERFLAIREVVWEGEADAD